MKKIGWLNTNDTELNRARQDVEALKQLKTEIENLIKKYKVINVRDINKGRVIVCSRQEKYILKQKRKKKRT